MDDKARAALARLVAQEGPLVGDDPRRVEGLLRDLVPQCRAEISVLATAARARVPHALGQSGGGSPIELRLTRLARELEQDAALAPAAARWAVDSWALALGLPVPASTGAPTPAPQVAPATDDSVWAPSAGTAPGAAAYPSYPSGGATGPTSARGPAQGAPPPQAPGYAPPGYAPPAYGPPSQGAPAYPSGPYAPPAGAPPYQAPQAASPGYAPAPYANGERPAGAGHEYSAPPGSLPHGVPPTGAPAPGGVATVPPAKKSRWKGWSAGLVTAAVLIRSCGAILRLAGDSTDEATAATADSTHVAAAASDSARGASPGAPSSGGPAVSTLSAAPSSAPSAAAPSSGVPSEPSTPAAASSSTPSYATASPGAAAASAPAASAPAAGAGGPQRGKWLVKWGRTGEQYTALLTMSGERGDLRVLVKDSGGNVLGIQQPVHLVQDDASGATGWVRADTAYVVKGNPPAGFSYSPDQLRYETSAGAVRFTQVCDAKHACQPLLLSFAGGGQ